MKTLAGPNVLISVVICIGCSNFDLGIEEKQHDQPPMFSIEIIAYCSTQKRWTLRSRFEVFESGVVIYTYIGKNGTVCSASGLLDEVKLGLLKEYIESEQLNTYQFELDNHRKKHPETIMNVVNCKLSNHNN